MTQILMVLMMSLAPAKADLKTEIIAEASQYTTSCRLVVARAELSGSVELYCTSRGQYRLVDPEIPADLVRKDSGSGKDLAEIIDLLESTRSKIITELSDAGFRSENAKCALPVHTDGILDRIKAQHSNHSDNEVRAMKISNPSGSVRVCIFNR